jgi:hypothetical protein
MDRHGVRLHFCEPMFAPSSFLYSSSGIALGDLVRI